MKIKLFSIVALGVILIASACSKKSDTTAKPVSATQNKSDIESTSATFITDMKSIQNSDGVNAVKAFNDLTAISTPTPLNSLKSNGTSGRPAAFFIIDNIVAYQAGKIKLSDIAKIRNSTLKANTHFVLSKYAKTYSWNPIKQNWDSTASTSLTIQFPTKGSTTNNASLTFDTYTDVLVSSIQGKQLDASEYIPTKVHMAFTIGGTKQLEFSYDATLDNVNFPSSIVATLYVNPYSLTYSLTVNKTAGNATYQTALKKSTTNIYTLGYSGTFDYTSLDAAVKLTDSTQQDKVINSFKTLSVYMQVYTIYFNLSCVDVKGFYAYEKSAGDAALDYAKINTFIKGYAQYKGSNSDVKIGDFVVYEKTVADMVWDNNTYQYVQGTKKEPGIKIIFADGTSPKDASEFFDKVSSDMSTFFNGLN